MENHGRTRSLGSIGSQSWDAILPKRSNIDKMLEEKKTNDTTDDSTITSVNTDEAMFFSKINAHKIKDGKLLFKCVDDVDNLVSWCD